MIDTIYIEHEVRDHPRTRALLDRFPKAQRIPCERYGEVFNIRAQSFRLQKRKPALILARKFDGHVLETPSGYGIGTRRNYYFSHMLNCPYDCRYCFLQGMFQSAHYVLFVNYEDFESAIAERVADTAGEAATFFSGYDCDSLALESVTGFAAHFVPFFGQLDDAWLELRTKSVQLRGFLDRDPLERIVIAFSLAPDAVARRHEHGAPPVARRIEALRRLAEHGWNVGLRFDPLVQHQGFEESYAELFDAVFDAVPSESVHSVSVGPMRFPRAMFETIVGHYPDEPLFAGPLENRGDMVSYSPDLEASLQDFCLERLRERIDPARIFSCAPTLAEEACR